MLPAGLMLAVAVGSMSAAESGPDACGRGLVCRRVATLRSGGAKVAVVSRSDADRHHAEQETTYSIYVRAAGGWFEARVSFVAADVAMSTKSRIRVARRRFSSATLSDGRPVVLVQLDLRDQVADRRSDEWHTTPRSVLVVCDAVGTSCTEPIRWTCSRQGCVRARVRGVRLTWRAVDGAHSEELGFP